jgi:hypothetical protein
MSYKAILTIVVLVAGSSAYGQVENQDEPPSSQRSTTLEPYYPEQKKSRNQKSFSPGKTNIDLQREYYERVEAVMKARKKMARIMRKPQYSNPMYFGHKRPPKKHSPKKMKYCRECGIRH